ncbi:COP23 domain-containing protein [Calothrix rhizosoleniae]|uniref:COP23 domain-containing protein n=1 Tax=Calothrix rhizosoleniae TaxID=888997 RepID=UPI000B49A86C|nr:COP23 domain-containing protein [Calothrix rhizosoleniae]
MSSPTLKFILCSGLGLSIFLANSIASAQTNRDVVVPTTSSPGNTNQNSNNSVTRTRTSNTRSRDGSSTSTVTTSTSSTNSRPSPNTNSSITSGTRFNCLFQNRQYTVMYQPESQPGRYFAWAVPRTLGGGWDAERRCRTIAERLERYRPDGLLELRNSRLNGYDTLCVTTDKDSSCRLILTIPPGQDAYSTRNQIFNNLTTADSGQETIGVNTYTSTSNGNEIEDIFKQVGIFGRRNRSSSINRSAVSKDAIKLKYFLDENDGGNSRYLRDGVTIRNGSNPASSGLQLNPNKFR